MTASAIPAPRSSGARSVLALAAPCARLDGLVGGLPASPPRDSQAFADWLRQQFKLKHPSYKMHDSPVQAIPWGDGTLQQPAQGKVEFHAAQNSWSAEYWVGNHYVSVKRQEVNAMGFLMRLHKGLGMNRGWILLIASLAGAMIFLAITGVLLWTKMRGSRLAVAGLCGTSLGLAVVFTLQSL